jgi:hypothetical protein
MRTAFPPRAHPATVGAVPVAPQKGKAGRPRHGDLLRYPSGEWARWCGWGLAIVGAIFVLALLAEVLSR